MVRILPLMMMLGLWMLTPACTTSVEERILLHGSVDPTPTPTPIPLPTHFGIRMLNDSFVSEGACRISRGSSLLCWGKSVITGDGQGRTIHSPSSGGFGIFFRRFGCDGRTGPGVRHSRRRSVLLG